MKTAVTEIADRIYRLSTLVPQIGPNGFTFNQFLIDAEEPLLFHYGHRAMFPLISATAASHSFSAPDSSASTWLQVVQRSRSSGTTLATAADISGNMPRWP